MATESLKADAREKWVTLYKQIGNVSVAARRCGIARSTLQRWIKRQEENLFTDRSHRPHRLGRQKYRPEDEALVLKVRDEFKYGKLRICSHLFRLHHLKISTSTVARILEKHSVAPIRRFAKHCPPIRYAKLIPGERVQLDVCKIRAGLYQYTAIDDCTRLRVLKLYKRRSAANSIDFLDSLIEEFHYPIQRIQTDRGQEFFAVAFQQKLMDYCIKFRPIKPRSPHLNGKVERSQQTDLQEFYSTVDLRDPELDDQLSQWQFHYNYFRPHSSLGGKTPIEFASEHSAQAPFWDQVEALYDETKERIREQAYWRDLRMAKLARKDKT